MNLNKKPGTFDQPKVKITLENGSPPVVPDIVVVDTDESSSSSSGPDEGANGVSWCPIDPVYLHRNLRRNSNISAVVRGEMGEATVLVLYTGGTIGMIRKSDDVYTPAPHMLEEWLRKMPVLHDSEYATKHLSNQSPPPLVLPFCGEIKRIIYTVYEYDPLLDSSNMTMDDWIRLATDINRFYQQVDGFVILHGTDTMAYTASALSFMMENLGKPVIITGSQIPIYESRSDALGNLLGSLIIAGNYSIPEVALFFNNKLFRGNRVTKIDAADFNAFNSPNMDPLVTFGINIHVDWKSIYRSANIEKFKVHTKLNRNVGLLRLFPSITLEMIQTFLRPPLEGVVLQSYGNGNAPSNRQDILFEFRRATDMGIIIINTTQCSKGYVQNSYETGKVLIDAGVIPGLDMTPEAALTKLSYVLGKDWSLDTKRKMMETNLRGEMTVNHKDNIQDLNLITAIARSLQMNTAQEIDCIKSLLFPSLLCAAAQSGNIQKMEILQQQGADVTAYNYDFRTPLHVAASEGRTAVVKYLLQNGANVHARDRNEYTPLMNALAGKHEAVVCLLHKAGAHVTFDTNMLGNMLCSLAAKGDIQALRLYKLVGIDLDQPDSTGRTALQAAIVTGQMECAYFLLDEGSDIHKQDKFGNSAERIAKQFSKLDFLHRPNCTNHLIPESLNNHTS